MSETKSGEERELVLRFHGADAEKLRVHRAQNGMTFAGVIGEIVERAEIVDPPRGWALVLASESDVDVMRAWQSNLAEVQAALDPTPLNPTYGALARGRLVRLDAAHGAESPDDPARPHIVGGEFQSDKYPTCPAGKVPLSTKDPMAQGLLYEYAQLRRAVDAEFADDLEYALRQHGYAHTAGTDASAVDIGTQLREAVATMDRLRSCPCQFEEIEPCMKQCTCRTPFLSGGCKRCCRYGSDEQQLAAARRLVDEQEGDPGATS